MAASPYDSSVCPAGMHAAGRDDRKSAAFTGAGTLPNAPLTRGYAAIRSVLRNGAAVQAGFRAELVARFGSPTRAPILFLSGAEHRRQRAATARFFAPRTVTERHLPVIEETAQRLIDEVKRNGGGRLDLMALDLAVSVASQIVGLTDSDKRGMIRRLDAFFSLKAARRADLFSGAIAFIMGQIHLTHFHFRDVRPAIRARRAEPREDVISHLIAEGYSNSEILVECFTYAAAGMVTTREFVTMAGWHLLGNDELRARFLGADRNCRIAILEEILRLEPVVGLIYRRLPGEAPVGLDIRSANGDPAAMGECPHQIIPDRERSDRVPGAGMAFGDGEHRCPGAGVALHEAEVFLTGLLRIPGIRMEKAPGMDWNPIVAGYELRDCRLVVDAAAN